jgi:hypothetical protein
MHFDRIVVLASKTLQQTTGFNLPAYGIRGPIPWTALPKALQDEYTMHGSIPVVEWYCNEAPGHDKDSIAYTESSILSGKLLN